MKTVVMAEFDLRTLIQEHQVGIWRYLRVLGCDANVAEDLTQETFLAIIEKPFDHRTPAETAAYLRTVARNLYVTHLRRSGRMISLEEMDLVDAAWKRLTGDDSGDALMIALESCLQTLGDKSRQALELRFRDRLTRADMADSLGLSEDGTKNLLQRAKKKLKACIERKLNVLQG